MRADEEIMQKMAERQYDERYARQAKREHRGSTIHI